MRMYHGSPYGGIESFDDVRFRPVFFTADKEVARAYAEGKGILGAQRDPGTGRRAPTVYVVDVDVVGAFDMRRPEHMALYDRMRLEMIRDHAGDEDVMHDYPKSTSEGFVDRRLGLPGFGYVRPLWRMLKEKMPGKFDSIWASEGSQGESLAMFEPRGKVELISTSNESLARLYGL